ncbi:MAG: aminotransferase class I/II-fold pyridoxal phosphate-dependent enzyme [bacterium]
MKKNLKFGTRLVSGWKKPHESTRPINPPIYQSATYVYDSLEHFMEGGSGAMLGGEGYYFYSRTGNPTNAMFEAKIAELEGAERAVSFASGMAAISTALLALLDAGDRVVAHDKLYSATDTLFEQYLPSFGIEVDMVDLTDLRSVRRALSKPAKVLFIESPANPLVEIVDIPEVARLARGAGSVVVVDSTWTSPYLMRPLELGADLVAASSTKYLSGHDDALGGYVAGGAELVSRVDNYMLVLGGSMSPTHAFYTMRGMRTLHVRMDRHCGNAREVAEFLESNKKVEKVYYPGLKSHPQHDVAKKIMSDYSGMIAFWLKGGIDEAAKMLSGLKVCNVAVSLGDACTLIEHPATMTHVTVDKEKRERLGITDGLIRLSVGLEDVRDLVRDLDRALMGV